MTIAIALALLFLLIFVAWLFSPRRGGHQPPKNTHPRPAEPPPPPPFAGWTKPVAPPNPADRPKGLPPKRPDDPYVVSVHKDGQIYIADDDGNQVLHALVKGPQHISIQVGTKNIVEIDKMYGPLVFMPIRVRMDFDNCAWIIERADGGTNWREVARLPGQLPDDFVD